MVIAGLHPSEGGPPRTAAQLSDALAKRSNLSVTIYSQTLTNQPVVLSKNNCVNRIIPSTSSHLSLKAGLPFRRGINRSLKAGSSTVIHTNGIWSPVHYWSIELSKRLKLPIVVEIHGLLEPWALNHKSFKKKLALATYIRNSLEFADVLLATSTAEYENIRRLGFKKPIAVIPNGIEFPDVKESGISKNPERIKKMLFLSRINVKKGLLNLVKAWSIARTQRVEIATCRTR